MGLRMGCLRGRWGGVVEGFDRDGAALIGTGDGI
jgi:hypothetical protein